MLSRLCLSSPTLRGIILLVLASFSLTVPSATAADHPELAGYTHDQIQRSCAYVSPFIGTDNPIGCLNGRLDVCTHILTSYRFGTSEDGKICRSAVEAKLLELQKADLLKMVDSLDRLLTGYALTVLPIPSSLPAWATNFRNIAPLPQIVIVVLVSIVLLGALLSYKPFPSPHVSQRIILGILIAIVAGPLIFFTPNFANPNRDFALITDEFIAANIAAAAIERDRRHIAALLANGERVSDADMASAHALSQGRFIPPVAAPVPAVVWLVLCFLPAAALTLICLPRAVFGYLYAFTKHPAASALDPKLKTGAPIYPDVDLAKVLTPKIDDVINPPPRRVSRNFAARASDYIRRMQADTDLAKAAQERDIARADMIAAKERLRKARQKLPWWRRWFT